MADVITFLIIYAILAGAAALACIYAIALIVMYVFGWNIFSLEVDALWVRFATCAALPILGYAVARTLVFGWVA